jgi:KipI family sensor histidine kinase inhibitor
MSEARIVAAGDAAWLIELENRIDPAVNARAIAIAEAVRGAQWAAVRDVVTGYRSVAVYVDPLSADGDTFRERLRQLVVRTTSADATHEAVVTVPVCYGGEYGPDLAEVAAFAGCSEAEAITLHAGVEYRVYMVGFVPGFPYMGTVDARIAAPRRQTPRVKVPTGSVGIAGLQTGIYPRETPGGWNLIGRTPLKPFDLNRAEPCAFRAGSRVRFVPVSAAEFAAWTE